MITKRESLNLLKINQIEKLSMEERRKHLLNLQELGMSERKIAEELNKPKSTIHDWLNPETRGYDRKREKKVDTLLSDFIRYVDNNQKFFISEHLSLIRRAITKLEHIKNRLEVEKVNEEL